MAERLRLGGWDEVGADAQRVRTAVFVLEQGIPIELEWDEQDPVSLHAVAYVDGEPVATGRLLPDSHIGRMAVLAAHRRSGLGGRILQRLIEAARARGDRAVELNAQSYVCAFYARHGFEICSEEFEEAGIPHRAMRLGLR
ncbi:MAG TPA: GNAT family N-acetyltransferase [Burkholderiaceae bacterium]|nr:GNAT family N-acetyltransferase [Burkholderiaceae bacterium]